jgi:hypothetical protein
MPHTNTIARTRKIAPKAIKGMDILGNKLGDELGEMLLFVLAKGSVSSVLASSPPATERTHAIGSALIASSMPEA